MKAQTTVEEMDEQGAEGRMVAATVVVVGLVGAAMVAAERGEEMGTADEATAEATGVVAEQEGGGLEMAVEVLVLAQLARRCGAPSDRMGAHLGICFEGQRAASRQTRRAVARPMHGHRAGQRQSGKGWLAEL